MLQRYSYVLAAIASVSLGIALRLIPLSVAEAQQTPFLYPPFLGSGNADASSVFDHTAPVYNGGGNTSNRMSIFDGTQYTCTITATAPIPRGACGNGGSYAVAGGYEVSYDGHNGIDYRIRYQPIVAAAAFTRVDAAGWRRPTDRTASYGLYVVVRHANGYQTLYGHLSSVAVSVCDPCSYGRWQLLGISGNSGNSTGAHLHFSVFDQAVADPSIDSNAEVVDPYGWTATRNPDWANNQRESLWVVKPDLGDNPHIYPDGVALPLPAVPSNKRDVDDSNPTQPNVWTQQNNGNALNGSWRTALALASSANPSAIRWPFTAPNGFGAGRYRVYVAVPSFPGWTDANYTDGAVYQVTHSDWLGRSGTCQTSNVVISQRQVISAGVTLGNAIYLGEFPFGRTGCGTEGVSLTNVVQGQITANARVVADKLTYGWVVEMPIPILLRRYGPDIGLPQSYPGPSAAALRVKATPTTLPAYP